MATTVRIGLLFSWGLSIFGISADVWAQDLDWESRQLREFNSYLLTLNSPSSNEPDYYSISSSADTIGGARIGKTGANVLLMLSEDPHIIMRVEVYESPITLDAWVAKEKEWANRLDTREHESGFINMHDRQFYYTMVSPKMVFDKNNKLTDASFDGPTGREVSSVYSDQVVVTVGFIGHSEPLDKGRAQIVDRIASSISLEYIEPYESFETTYHYGSTSVWLNGHEESVAVGQIEAEIAEDWVASEDEIVIALDNPNLLGHLVVGVRPAYGDFNAGSASPELLLRIEAFKDKKKSAAEFLEHGNVLVRRVVPDAREVSRSLMTDDFEIYFGGHCYSEFAGKGNAVSNGVHAITYVGTNSSGQSVTARLYSAGGYNVACNYLFVDDSAAFDRNVVAVERMLATVKAKITGPPLE